jgi:hypothetical protein
MNATATTGIEHSVKIEQVKVYMFGLAARTAKRHIAYYGTRRRLRYIGYKTAGSHSLLLHADHLKTGSDYFVAWTYYVDKRTARKSTQERGSAVRSNRARIII